MALPTRTPADAAPLVVVFNLASGSGDAAQTRQVIESRCRDAGRALELLVVDPPSRLPEVARQAAAQARQRGAIVVAAGGDGTLSAVAQATLGSGCAFGVLPQGTFNYFGRSHGIPSDTGQAMALLLSGVPRPVQVGLVNDRVFIVNASLGLYAKVLEDREAWKALLGRSRLVALAAGFFTLLGGGGADLRLSIELNGRQHAVRTPSLFVGNNALQMAQVGAGLATQIEAGQLGALVLKPLGRLAMLGLLLRGALGRLGEADQVTGFAFGRLTVRRGRWSARRTIKIACDGEVGRMRLPLEFSVSPQPLLLVQRPPDDAA